MAKKVILNGNTIMDVTDTTATSSDVMEGKVFYDANGVRTVGVAQQGSLNPYEDIIDAQSTNKKGEYLFSNFDGTQQEFEDYWTAEVKAKVKSPKGLFYGASNITDAQLNGVTMTTSFSAKDIFNGCTNLGNIPAQGIFLDWDTSHQNITDIEAAFNGCDSMTAIDVSYWGLDTQTAKFNLNHTFAGCSHLTTTTFEVPQMNFVKVYSARSTFEGDSSLTTLNISKWQFQSECDIYHMFKDCTSLASISLPQSFVQALVRYDVLNLEAFYNCVNLTSVSYHGSKAEWKVGDYLNLFNNCNISQQIIVACSDGTFTYTWNSSEGYYDVAESISLINGYYINSDRSDSFYIDASAEKVVYNEVDYSYIISGNTLNVQTLGQMDILAENETIYYNNDTWTYFITLYTLQDGTYIGTDGTSSWTLDSSDPLNPTATDENSNSYIFTVANNALTIDNGTFVYYINNDNMFTTTDGVIGFALQSPQTVYHPQDGTYNRTQGSGSNYYIIDTANSTATNSNNVARTYVDNNDGTFTMDKGNGNYETYYLTDNNTFQNQAGTTIYVLTV